MKIINIGILAHVDAGKTTLTESLLYASGAISEPGSVEKGTTRTDTMFLERQRGITIQAAVTSFQWHRCKVNIVDTPGHMDFLAEVYRSLAVLDGAILVISAKDGVQAQTRILFHALRKMNIPTVIFINKIDQAGVDLQSVVQSVRDKLSADIIIKQTVSLSPEIVLEENTDIEAWDAVIENNDELLEKYIAGEPISREKLAREEQQRVQDASLFPVYHGSAKNGLGIQPLMDAVTGLFQPIGEQGSAALCGSVFKVEYTDCGQRRVYLRLYSGTLRLRDTVALAGREKLKITEMRIPSKGEIVRTDTAYPGEIVILPSDSVRLNDVLGDQTRLPRKRWREDPLPMLRTTIAPKTAAQRERLLDALAWSMRTRRSGLNTAICLTISEPMEPAAPVINMTLFSKSRPMDSISTSILSRGRRSSMSTSLIWRCIILLLPSHFWASGIIIILMPDCDRLSTRF